VDRHIFKKFLNFLLGKGRGKVTIQRHIYLKILKKFSGGMAYERKFLRACQSESFDSPLKNFLKNFRWNGR
jgi:hypothetical protein